MVGENRGWTRGPLSPAVYWRRRAVVIAIALLLVVGITWALNLGSDGKSKDEAAQVAQTGEPTKTVTVEASPSGSDSSASDSSDSSDSSDPSDTASMSPSTPVTDLPEPTGSCDPADIIVEPEVHDAVAYSDVTITVGLRTSETEACTFDVSPKSMQLRLSNSSRRLWSSLDCPQAMPRDEVTVYRDVDKAYTQVSWNGHRSDGGLCGAAAAWARPGTMEVTVAALGGEPASADFKLADPSKVAEESASESPSASPSKSASGSPSGSASGSPSGSASTEQKPGAQRQRKPADSEPIKLR